MLESFQVFILCCVIGMFLSWVMYLKKQIIALMEENQKLKAKAKEKLADELAGTSVTKDQPSWARKH
jgi:regulator of replication initiation timing